MHCAFCGKEMYADIGSYNPGMYRAAFGNVEADTVFIHRWLVTHSTISHAPMSLPFWGANRTRGFRERQSPIIKTVPSAAG